MLSNQIPLPDPLDDVSDSDSADEVETAVDVVQPKHLKESLALSASGNSGTKSPGGSGLDSLVGSRNARHASGGAGGGGAAAAAAAGDVGSGGGGNFDEEDESSASSSDWDSASDDCRVDLEDRLLQSESMLLRLKHLVGDAWWDAIAADLRADSEEKVTLIAEAVQRARVRREKAEAAKNNKKAKVTFQDDFGRRKGGRGGGGGGGGGARFKGDGRLVSGNKKPLNRCHSSMN